MRRTLMASAGFALTCLLGSAQALAQNAYITNNGDNTVSVIATATSAWSAPRSRSGQHL